MQLANAANYLEAFGHLVVGWLWLDQAITLHENLATSSATDFLNGKLAACDYFLVGKCLKFTVGSLFLIQLKLRH